MKNLLSPTQQANLFAQMTLLVKTKNKVISEKTTFFTNAVIVDFLEETMFFICNYIRRPTTCLLDNESLQHLWARMCIYLLMLKYKEEGEGSGTATGGVLKEIKSGNATVKYEVTGSTGTDLGLVAPFNSLDKFKIYLNDYRRAI